MLIRVICTDGHYDMVKASAVDALISSSKIVKFYRSGHWVVIGAEPLRGMGGGGARYGRRESDREELVSIINSSGRWRSVF